MSAADPADRHVPAIIDSLDFETNLVANLVTVLTNERVFGEVGADSRDEAPAKAGKAPRATGRNAPRGKSLIKGDNFVIYGKVSGKEPVGKIRVRGEDFFVYTTPSGKEPAGKLQVQGQTFVVYSGSTENEYFTPAARLEKLIHAVRAAIRTTVDETEHRHAFLDPSVLAIAEVVERTLPRTRQQISQDTIEKLVDALAETHDPVAQLNAEIDSDNARARVRFMNNFLTLTAEDVTTAAGSIAKNRSQTASRWKSEGKIFSVPWQGQERFPAFQFKDGRPLPIIAKILAALPAGMSPWEIAFWFVSANSWLDGAAPRAKLNSEDGVIEAARSEAAAIAE
jgi:hypothetical protein